MKSKNITILFNLVNDFYFEKGYYNRQNAFLIAYNKFRKEFELLISAYYSLTPKNKNFLSFIREGELTEGGDLILALSMILSYIEQGDLTTLKEYTKSINKKIVWIIKLFLSGKFLNVGEDFVLSVLKKLYTKEELYALLKIENLDLKDYKIKLIRGVGDKLNYPFNFYTLPKGVNEYKIYNFVKKGNLIDSNLKNKKITNFLKETLKFKNDIVFYFIYEKDVLVPLFATENGKKIKTFRFKKTNSVNVKYPTVKEINTFYDLKYLGKNLIKKHLIIDNFGIKTLKLKTRKSFIKVLDYWFDENLLPIGFILENGQKIKYKITDEIVTFGLKHLYIQENIYYFNNQEIHRQIADLQIGMFRKCVCCGNYFSKFKKQLCPMCYKNFYEVAISNIDNEFVEQFDFIKNHYFETEVEKYKLYGIGGKNVKFIRDDSLLPKGYQFKLPLKFN